MQPMEPKAPAFQSEPPLPAAGGGQPLPPRQPAKFLQDLFRQPLFTNAWYILGVSLFPALLGFIFWKVCSHYFLPDEVGMGAALLSAAGVVIALANMGINIGTVRFLPSADDPDLLLSNALSVTLTAAVAFMLLFLLGSPLWSPELVPLLGQPVILAAFALYILATTVGTTLRGVYIARRKSIFAFAYTALANIFGLIMLFVMLAYPVPAILVSNTFGYGAAMLISWFSFRPKAGASFRFHFRLDGGILKQLLPYSFSSYIANFLFLSYQSLFPLIVLHMLGSESSGYIYVVLMIFGAAVSPGLALGYSAFSEGTNDLSRRRAYFRRATLTGTGLTLLISLLLLLGARWVLLLFGSHYPPAGTAALRWLAVAAPLVVINQIYAHLLRGIDRPRELVWMNATIFSLSVAMAILLLPRLGISAISIGLLSGNLVVLLAWARPITAHLFNTPRGKVS